MGGDFANTGNPYNPYVDTAKRFKVIYGNLCLCGLPLIYYL
jgi:hypothetical protein